MSQIQQPTGWLGGLATFVFGNNGRAVARLFLWLLAHMAHQHRKLAFAQVGGFR